MPPEFRPEPQDERDLRWFFGLGPTVKRRRLTLKQRRRYDRIAACLAGRGRRLCLYYTNPRGLRDLRIAALIDESDVRAALSWCLKGEFCQACNRYLQHCKCFDWNNVDAATLDGDRDREHRMVFGYLATHAVFALRTEYARFRRARIKIERRGRGRPRAADVREEARRNAGIVISFDELAGALANGRETLQVAFDRNTSRAAASVTHWYCHRGETVFWLRSGVTPEACARSLINEGSAQWATWGAVFIHIDNAKAVAERWFVDVAANTIAQMGTDDLRSLFLERAKRPRAPRSLDEIGGNTFSTVDRYQCPSCGKGEIVDAGKAASAACPACKRRFSISRLQWLDAKAALKHDKAKLDAKGRSQFFTTMAAYGLDAYEHRGRHAVAVVPGAPHPDEDKISRDLGKGYTTLSDVADGYRPMRHRAVEEALIRHGIMAHPPGLSGSTLKRKRLPLAWFATERGRDFAKEMERRRDLSRIGGHFSPRYTTGANDGIRVAYCPSSVRPKGQ